MVEQKESALRAGNLRDDPIIAREHAGVDPFPQAECAVETIVMGNNADGYVPRQTSSIDKCLKRFIAVTSICRILSRLTSNS